MNSSEVALTEAQLTYNQSIYDYLVAKADLDLVLGIDVYKRQHVVFFIHKKWLSFGLVTASYG